MATRVPTGLIPVSGRRFGFTVGAGFLVLAVLSWLRSHNGRAEVLAALAAALVLAALIAPGSLGPAQRAWSALGLAMSKVTTPVFLFLLYIAVFAPFGLLLRAFGSNPVVVRRGGATLWEKRSASHRSSLDRQF